MNRLELPAPPASQPYFPFPPAPRKASGLHELGEGPCLDVPTAELHAAIVPLP